MGSMGGFFLHNALIRQISTRFDIFKSGKKSKEQANFNSWLFSVSETGIAGNIDQVESMRFWKLCELLHEMAKRADAIEKQRTKTKKK